ncbi:MAG: hypothetical protein JO307_24025 [Bryobacterales bacterium]|nr:hypothetical protein [Bryobacterales bacterium]MBV9396906.1 hypothetical protein [Bryobacterales bacterium]
MDTIAIAAIICAVIAIALVIWVVSRQRNTQRLRSRFGPEYDRAVEHTGDRRRAETDLQEREQRIKRLHIRELTGSERERFINEWIRQQSHFIDQPARAVAEADALVSQVMTTRGYPMSDFETQAADISVDHGRVVDTYREAHAIAMRSKAPETTTEELRRAMVCYRELFEDLVGRRVFTSEREEVSR